METSALPLFPEPSSSSGQPFRVAVDPPALAFTVFGEAAPAGSKRSVPVGKSGHQRFVVIDANPKAAKWKERVAQVAGQAMQDRPLFRGPLDVTFTFYRRRPKGHFGKRGLLPSAPAYPTSKPDALKLARGVEDALRGVVYSDDSLICREHLSKEFGEPERCEVEVREL